MSSLANNKLNELEAIISKMPLEMICTMALPEFGVKWREVSQTVRNNRLPMQPASIARVLRKYVSKVLTLEEIIQIVTKLRLKLAATQNRTWHVIRLHEQIIDEPVTATIQLFESRVKQALTNNKNRDKRPEIQTVLLGDLMYVSIRLVSDAKEGAILYIATPPGEPVALVSSLTAVQLLKGCVGGLGYQNYENANLYGRDIHSLLRINDRHYTANADQLTNIPVYAPTPIVTANGIDYTNKTYDENYVDTILGPNPPMLNELHINMTKPFFDRSKLDKNISLSVTLKSDDIAKTLKSLVIKGALAPTSDFFKIFHEIKSNKIVYDE